MKTNPVQKEINQLQLEKVKDEVLHLLSLTNDNYNSQITSFTLNQRAFKIAKTNYNLATEKQNRGIINSFMLRDIEIAYITSGINAQQSAYKLMESKIALLKITGGIVQNYTKQ